MAHYLARFGGPERWKETKLPAGSRPIKVYEYFVTGRGEFPVDMLRYDCAWPASSADAAKIGTAYSDPHNDWRSIRLKSYRPPTVDRWSSFIWSVGTEEMYK